MTHDLGYIVESDAAINFNLHCEAATFNHTAQATDLVKTRADEGLAAKARIDAHQENVINIRQGFFNSDQRRQRIEHDARTTAEVAYGGQRPVQVGDGFDVDRDQVRAGAREVGNVAVGVGDHQMAVKRQPCRFARGFDNERADSNVRHKMPIHDVDVNQARAAALGSLNLFAEPREIG